MTYGSSKIKAALIAFAVTALGAGLVWASESATKCVPQSGAWSAVIEFDPGCDGAYARGTSSGCGPRLPDDEVDFDITLDGDGNGLVNGQVEFSWKPGEICRVKLHSYEVDGKWFVDVSIYEGADLVYQQQGSVLGHQIECLHVTAEAIAEFSVIP